MKRKILLSLFFAAVIVSYFGFAAEDPYGSRTRNVNQSQNIIQAQPLVSDQVNAAAYYTDNFDGTNDTTSLKNRGYKVYYRGGGPQAAPTWFQGNPVTTFNAYNGPTNGYVASNYQSVTNANNIDNWLVLPAQNVFAGDTISFYQRSPTSSTYPDSIRVMYSASGDSVPEAGTWVELGRFKGTTTGSWLRKTFTAASSGTLARFAIRYCVVDGGPLGDNSDYWGMDALSLIRGLSINVANVNPAYIEQIVPVPVNVAKFNGVGTFQIKINFNNPKLTLAELPVASFNGRSIVTNSLANANATKELIIVWYSDGSTPLNLGDGNLLNLKIFVAAGATGPIPITFNQALVSDLSGNQIIGASVGGNLSLQIFPPPVIVIPNLPVGPNNKVLVPVNVTNFNTVAGFDIRIDFPSTFNINHLTDVFDLPLTVTSTGYMVKNVVTNGATKTLIIGWYNTGGDFTNTFTVGTNGSGVLCNLLFTYAGEDAGVFPFTFSITPKTVTVTGVELSGSGVSGSITVPIRVDSKTFLEGPFSSGSMVTTLRSGNYLPLTQPYSAAPFNYTGLEVVASIPVNVVDWVLVELRSGTAASTIVAKRAAFLLSNGSVVDTDGVSPVMFPALTSNGSYYVVIRHRNHLAAMSITNPLLKNTGSLYDFSATGQSYGTNGMKDLGAGVFGLFTGDANTSGIVTVSDISTYIPTLNQSGYLSPDVNLSGIVTVADFQKTIPNLNLSTQVPN